MKKKKKRDTRRKKMQKQKKNSTKKNNSTEPLREPTQKINQIDTFSILLKNGHVIKNIRAHTELLGEHDEYWPSITARHLMSHTSGLGKGPPGVKFVTQLHERLVGQAGSWSKAFDLLGSLFEDTSTIIVSFVLRGGVIFIYIYM